MDGKRVTRWLLQWVMGTAPAREDRMAETTKQDAADKRLRELTERLDVLDHNIGLLAGRHKGRIRS